MINVIASIRVKSNRILEFIEIFKSNVPAVLKEVGCKDYSPTVDIDANLPPQGLDKNIITVIEKWESLEALHNHLKSSHMQLYMEKVKDMVEDLSIKVLKSI